MDARDYWTRKRDQAEAELDAAKGRIALNAAAKRLRRARAELKRLDHEQEKPKRPAYPWPWVGGRFRLTCCASSISMPHRSRCSTTRFASLLPGHRR